MSRSADGFVNFCSLVTILKSGIAVELLRCIFFPPSLRTTSEVCHLVPSHVIKYLTHLCSSQYYALQILETVIKTRWKILPRNQCEGQFDNIIQPETS